MTYVVVLSLTTETGVLYPAIISLQSSAIIETHLQLSSR